MFISYVTLIKIILMRGEIFIGESCAKTCLGVNFGKEQNSFRGCFENDWSRMCTISYLTGPLRQQLMHNSSTKWAFESRNHIMITSCLNQGHGHSDILHQNDTCIWTMDRYLCNVSLIWSYNISSLCHIKCHRISINKPMILCDFLLRWW